MSQHPVVEGMHINEIQWDCPRCGEQNEKRDDDVLDYFQASCRCCGVEVRVKVI